MVKIWCGRALQSWRSQYHCSKKGQGERRGFIWTFVRGGGVSTVLQKVWMKLDAEHNTFALQPHALHSRACCSLKTIFPHAALQGTASHTSSGSSACSQKPMHVHMFAKVCISESISSTQCSVTLLLSFKDVYISPPYRCFEAGSCLLQCIHAGLSTEESRPRLKPPNAVICK